MLAISVTGRERGMHHPVTRRSVDLSSMLHDSVDRNLTLRCVVEMSTGSNYLEGQMM
jgi:hypothetical protein